MLNGPGNINAAVKQTLWSIQPFNLKIFSDWLALIIQVAQSEAIKRDWFEIGKEKLKQNLHSAMSVTSCRFCSPLCLKAEVREGFQFYYIWWKIKECQQEGKITKICVPLIFLSTYAIVSPEEQNKSWKHKRGNLVEGKQKDLEGRMVWWSVPLHHGLALLQFFILPSPVCLQMSYFSSVFCPF